ncbi:RGAG4: Retrotransposon gag domain-containing protein 4 [Crotalus adamanteus]|uniref:RGAG4: Retrotransposon gag domain-containing protein 4 n=1 Tax=Crotalus adamanteus TaxID=8729 RepID=A0AAW1BN98_CROAD
MLVHDDCEPPPLRVTFDGWPEKLAYLLNQVWNYLEWYGATFPDKGANVNAITANLEEEAAEWVMAFHDEGLRNWETSMLSWRSFEPDSGTPHISAGKSLKSIP